MILAPFINGASIFLVEEQEKKMIETIAINLKSKFLTLIDWKVLNLLKTLLMKCALVFLFVVFLFDSCLNPFKKKEKKLSEDSKISDTHFISDKIGWGIKLPGKDWEIILPKGTKGFNEKAKQDIEKSLGLEVEDASVQELICFRKDSLNNFVAIIEPYRFSTDNEYEQMLRFQHDFFKDGYASRNIPAESEMGDSRI